MGFEINKKDLLKELKMLTVIFIIIALIGICILIGLAFGIGSVIGHRLMRLEKKIEILAQGNFDFKLDEKELKREDEIGSITIFKI